MSFQVKDDYKEELLNHFSKAIKQIQMECISTEGDGGIKPCIQNNSPAGRILFSCLEMILCYGLKRQDLGIWHAVEYFCRNDVKRKINNLEHVKTNKGKSRAWIYLTLNEKELEGYFQSFQTNLEHFYKFYARSALVCSSQVSLLQTLISGLDWVVFNLELDVSYLDYSIMAGQTWRKDESLATKTTKILTRNDRGSVVHIDTKSITEVGQKAVGLIKGIMSHENSSSTKSMKDIDSNMLVAVNSNQRYMQGKQYCPDCGSPNELICLCDSKRQEPVQNVHSKNTEILQTFLQCDESNMDRTLIFQERINPLHSEYKNKEEIEMSTRFRRFDVHIAVTDTPIEVERKARKRRKKFSHTSSICSNKSEDVNLTMRNSMQKSGSHSKLPLSNPLIGFDPGSEDDSHPDCEFSLLNINDVHDESAVFDQAETNTVRCDDTCLSKDDELSLEEITGSDLHTNCLLSCQNLSIGNLKLEIFTEPEQFVDLGILLGTSSKMETEGTQVKILDTNDNASSEKDIQEPIDDSVSDKVQSFDVQDTCHIQDVVVDHLKDVEDERRIDPTGERKETCHSRSSSVDSKTGSQLSTPAGSCVNFPTSSHSTPIKRSVNDFATSSDCDERMAELNNESNQDDLLKDKDVRLMSPAEKKDFRKMKSAKRYRSQSEKLLEDLTKREVERLRAEIEARLKPSRDKLEKVQKYMLERTASLEIDSADLDEIPSTSNAASLDLDVANNETEIDNGLTSTDTKSVLTSPQEKTDSIQPHRTTFKAVANISNTLRLYLMLEILLNESEEILKMFHLSTGHSEGNWTALYLLFTDSCIYFLRSGDGNCPYQSEHVVSYEDMDYASVGSHDQTIEFVFYKTKKSLKPRKQPSSKYRAKVLVDSCDEDLTNLLISTLAEAVSTHTRRWGAIKVCPPVFRDSREHEISLVKYLRSEGLTGDIQYYQLVHWEDPDFVKGANVGKVFMQGTLKYKVHSFWGTSTKSAYFVLSGGILYQYANRESQKPDCSYELTGGKCVGCQRIKSSDVPNSVGMDFVIDFQGDSKLELSGFSIMEVTEWLQCLCMIVSLDQSSRIDQQACTDGIVMDMLNRDALVPCSLIIADETLLLCHEDHHTGFCRTLATAKREEIRTVNIDRTGSIMCELAVEKSPDMPQTEKWGVFFPRQEMVQAFLNVVDSFSKAPSLCEKGRNTDLTHYLEARALLDNRWTRTDNLLKGRSTGSESYTFV